MSQKKSLIVINILIVITAVQFWSRKPDAGKANADPLQQDAPILSFDRALVYVVEPEAGEIEILTLRVVISSAPEQGEEAKVTYRSANASAIAGVDFVPAAGELTFPSDSTASQTFDVTIIGNDFHQPDREFVVYLTNPANAIVGIPGSITITILDDDPMPVTPISISWNYLPIIRRHAEPTSTPRPPTPTPGPTATPSGSTPVDKGDLSPEDLTIDTLGAGATDRWNLDLLAGEMVTLTVAPGAAADIVLAVLDGSGAPIVSDQNTAAPGEVETIKDLKISSPGIHQLLIRTEEGIQTDYALMFMDSESYSFVFRGVLQENAPQSDSLAADNDHFWFFNAQRGECVSFSITPDGSGDPYIELYDPNGSLMLTIDDNDNGEPEALENYTLLDTGLYSIRVAEFDFLPMSYQIVLTKPCMAPDATAAPLYTRNGRTPGEIHVLP